VGIEKAFEQDENSPMVLGARKAVESNTWNERAERIIKFIKKDIV
jgi:hypothetical protein